MASYSNGVQKVSFRILNEVPEKSKIFKFGRCVWNGPTCSISVECFIRMMEIFEEIKPQSQPNVRGMHSIV